MTPLGLGDQLAVPLVRQGEHEVGVKHHGLSPSSTADVPILG